MSQVLAIAFVRIQLLFNNLRKRTTNWEMLATAITLLLGLGLSLGLALLGGKALQSIAGGESPRSLQTGLLVCFSVVTILGVITPIVLSSGTSGLDMSQLTLFPIRRRRLFVLSWLSAFLSADHVFYYPLLGTCFLALLANGALGGFGGGLAFVLLPVVVITWSFGLLSMLQAIMRHRRAKEIGSMLAFSFFIAVSVLPTIMLEEKSPTLGLQDGMVVEQATGELTRPVIWLLHWTPPGLATDSITAFRAQRNSDGWGNIGLLAIWLATGWVISYSVFLWRLRSHTGAGRAESGGSGRARAGLDATRLFPFVPPAVVAVATKELRYVMRSSVGKLNIALVPLICAFLMNALKGLGTKFAPLHAQLGDDSDHMMLFGMMLYGVLFTNNFVSNSAGWEGPGFKTYLLAPVSFQRVLVGKNIGIWIYSSVLYILVIAAWCVVQSPPPAIILLKTAAFFGGSIVLFTAVGNFASLAFPIRRDISAMKSQPSHPAVLMSLCTVVCLAGFMVFLVALSLMIPGFGMGSALGLYVLAAGVTYALALPRAAALFHARRDQILAKIEVAD